MDCNWVNAEAMYSNPTEVQNFKYELTSMKKSNKIYL